MAAAVITTRAHASVPDLTRRHYISQIFLDLFKFAVGSAIDDSRKIIAGRKQLDKMVPKGLINMPLPTPLKAKKKLDSMVPNEIHSESKMEEDMKNIQQQYKTSAKHVEESQPANKSGDNFKELNLFKKNGRRVFIRSRL